MTGTGRWPRAGWPVLVVALAAALVLPGLGDRDAWAPDEPRHAEVAREVLLDGHWWYPHVNSRPYADKPPLYFWLAAAAGLPAGDVDELAARAPAALAAILTVLLVASMAARLHGELAALLAGCALATTWLFAWMARRVSLDVLLTLLVVLGVWCALRASDSARSGSRRGAIGWLALAGLAAGLGIMTKGPVGLLFLVFAIVPLALVDRRDGAPWPVASGLALLAALGIVLAAWLVPAHAIGGYDPLEVTREHVVERAAQGRHHSQPPHYYLTTIPVDFLPWSVFAIPALLSAWRARRERDAAFLLAWAIGPVLVLSIVVEKRNIYLLPLVPAWILLVARWAAAQAAAPGAWLVRAEAALWWLVVCLGAGVAALPWLAPRVLRGSNLEIWSSLAPPALVTCAAGLIVLASALVARWRSCRPHAPRLAWLALAFAVALAAVFAFLPRLDQRKSGREMGQAIARIVGDSPLGMYPRTWDAYVFYSRRSMRDLTDAAAIRDFLAASPRPAFILLYRKDATVLAGIGEPAVEVAADHVGHREVVLFRVGDPS